MIGRAEPQLGATRAKQGLPELANEKGVSVGDEATRELVYLHDNVNKEGSHRENCVGCWQHAQMNPLGETIDHHENGRVAAIVWKASNKIKGQVLPWSKWDRKRT